MQHLEHRLWSGRGESMNLENWAQIVKKDKDVLTGVIADTLGDRTLAIDELPVQEALDILQRREAALAVLDCNAGNVFRIKCGVDVLEVLGDSYQTYSQFHTDQLSVTEQIPGGLWDLDEGDSVVVPQLLCICQLGGLARRIDDGQPVMAKATRFLSARGKFVGIDCPTPLLNSSVTSDEKRATWLARRLGQPIENVRRFPPMVEDSGDSMAAAD